MPLSLRLPTNFATSFAAAAAIAGVATVSLPLTGRAAVTAPTVSSGTYVDGMGGKQAWHIDQAHRLIWDDKPFVPIGGLFQPRSWAPDATDADWQADQEALAILKAHNVTDIYLQPVKGFGLTDVPIPAIQRLLDKLDTDGFTYGISIMDGPRNPLTGYVVTPTVYRQEVPDGVETIHFAADSFNSFLYFVASASDSQILANGESRTSNGSAVVPIPRQISQFGSAGAKIVGTVIPQKQFRPGDTRAGGKIAIGYPDLWGNFDDYRDRLLTLFRGVRLGKNFRFFVDALPPTLSLDGNESEHFVPTGSGFTTEWGAYLSRKYKTQEKLEQAWGVTDHQAKDINEDAMFVPLWANGRGVKQFYDRVTKKLIGVQPDQVYPYGYWNDLSSFKSESIQRYMNDLALSLKRAVADVPVVYRSNGFSPLFQNLTGDEGFDGIGMEAYGRGAELVQNSAGAIYSQTAASMRTLWLPVTGTAEARLADKTAPGYATQFSMQSDFDYLREIGARGFYVDALYSTGTFQKNRDLTNVPVQLDWLSGYQKLLVATGVRAPDTIPDTWPYPRTLDKFVSRQTRSGQFLVPTDKPFAFYDFGDVGSAYALSEASGTVYYLYNLNGSRKVKIRVPKALTKSPNMVEPTWLPLAAGTRQKDTIELTIGPDPVRIINLPSIPVPTDAYDTLHTEAITILATLKKRNHIDGERYQEYISVLREDPQQPIHAVQLLQTYITQMKALICPYAWLEAETPFFQAFDEISSRAGASGGRVLVVDPRAPGMPTAFATYRVDVDAGGPYEVWAAASPGAPLTFRLDSAAMIDQPTAPQKVGDYYAEGSLVWQRYGTATLPHGSHTLEVRASGPAAIDVILLIQPGQFKPNGATQPPVLPEH